MVLTEHILSRFLPSVENVSNSMMNASSHPLQSWRPLSLSSPCPWTYPRCWSSGPEKKQAFPLAMLGDVTAESVLNPNSDWTSKAGSSILTWVGRGLCITPLRLFFPQVAMWLTLTTFKSLLTNHLTEAFLDEGPKNHRQSLISPLPLCPPSLPDFSS